MVEHKRAAVIGVVRAENRANTNRGFLPFQRARKHFHRGPKLQEQRSPVQLNPATLSLAHDLK